MTRFVWARRDALPKRIHDLQAVDVSAVLHVFREKYGAAGLFGGTDDECVPEGKVVKAVQINGGEDVGDIWSGDVELGEQFDFAAGDGRLHMQFSGGGDEIFLQDLERDYAGAGAAMLGYEIDGAALLGGRGLIVSVDEDDGVEEATSGHYLCLVESCRE